MKSHTGYIIEKHNIYYNGHVVVADECRSEASSLEEGHDRVKLYPLPSPVTSTTSTDDNLQLVLQTDDELILINTYGPES
jgi:hypothetical protein